MTGPTALTPAPTVTITAPTPLSLPPGPPSFDVIEALPPAAADKLRMLRQRSADAHRLIPEFETVREASLARIEAENAVKRLTNHPQDGGFNLPETDARVVAAQKHLDKMTANLKRLTELQTDRTAQWHAAGASHRNVEDRLKSGRPANTTLETVETEPPKLSKSEDVLSAIERTRRRVRELKADLHRIASAPFPSSYAKQRMRAQIEALAMQAPSVSRLVEIDGPVDFQTQRVTSEVHSERRSLAFTEVPDAVALVAWLHKDALIAALDREIAAEADDKSALTREAREMAAAEVQADLLAVERDESELVWRAQSEGLPVEHRADISPVALLGLRLVVTAPRSDETPGTTPGYSWPWRR